MNKRPTCFCGKRFGPDHQPVAAYGSWCCPDALAEAAAFVKEKKQLNAVREEGFMPRTREITLEQFQQSAMYSKVDEVRWPLEKLQKMVKEGAKVEFIESSFTDAGNDYTMVRVGGQQVAYWAGY